MSKKYKVEVQENSEGEAFIEFPEGVIEELGWREGDTIKWEDNHDGSFTLKKKQKTEWVLVDTIGQFRMRYLVEVPVGKDEWALDTVTMNEAKEFSQVHLGETIVSHRVVTVDEALKVFDTDNDYLQSWDEELKIKTAFTSIADLEQTDKGE
jgi:hypothetical protein